MDFYSHSLQVIPTELPALSPKLGWMVSALVIDPFNSDRLMSGTGATIYGANNLGNWDRGQPINISVMAQGLEETAVLDIISPPTGAHLLSALGDITGFRHDDLSLAPARMYDNPRDTPVNLDYAARNSNFVVRVGNGNANHIAFSFDGGATWAPSGAQPAGTNGRGIIQGDSHGPNGGCAVTPAVYANTPWYNEQVVRLDNNGDVDITALSVTIRIQRTAGLNHSGQYNNVGGGQILQSHSGDATTMTYQFTLAPGQTLRPGSGFAFAAQTGGSGNHHPMGDDAYTVNYKAGGASFTQTGRF